MIINTDAIVLKTFPYGETSLISRCFTKDKGKISFIIKGAKSKKILSLLIFSLLALLTLFIKKMKKRTSDCVKSIFCADMD